MQKIIQHNKPTIGREEIKAVADVLLSGWLAQGKKVEEFENNFCSFLGERSGKAAAFSSGTAALYATLNAFGVKRGDEVIMPSYVCSALLNAVYLVGATPIIVDVNSEDLNISITETEKKINSKTKAIIVPHIFGMPADIDEFIELGIPVIEDCAQALGAEFKGRPVGAFGKAAVFSFYASKVITTGYGGMVYSMDKKLMENIFDYREFDCRKEYKPRFNLQMSDFQAAMGIVQLQKLPSLLQKRKSIAEKYYKILPSDKVWPPQNIKNKQPNYYRFLLKINNPEKAQKMLVGKGIKTIMPIERYELLHNYLKLNPAEFPVSEKITKTVLSIPIFPSLTNQEVNYLIKELKKSI